jgi:hypothetical protein
MIPSHQAQNRNANNLRAAAGIADGLGRPAVPTLPDARGTMFDGEVLRRERVVVDEPVGDVHAADLRQRQHVNKSLRCVNIRAHRHPACGIGSRP